MPALDSAKHERFAQELAKGSTQEEAYRAAGYRGDRTAACRLATNVNVIRRVAEIQERAAIRAEISVAELTARLLNIAAKGEATDDAPMLSVARASLMDAAKLNGLVVDKRQTDASLTINDVTADPESEAEWMARHAG